MLKEVKDQNYPDHVPLNTAQNALLAVGSGIMGVLDTTRGGKLESFLRSDRKLILRSDRDIIRIDRFDLLTVTSRFYDRSSRGEADNERPTDRFVSDCQS